MGNRRGRRRNRGGAKPADIKSAKSGNQTEPSGSPEPSPGKNQPGRNQDGHGTVRTYFKVFATFKCSKCARCWKSAHAWEREADDGGINCEICQHPAELVNSKDEMLKLDTYLCGCENIWQSIHVEENLTIPQECDMCNVMVFPDGSPQERFGRHYFLRCCNKECPESECVEWEDFSLNKQKTQRCSKCGSRGDIVRTQKLKQMPPWQWKRLRLRKMHEGGGCDNVPDMEEKPSNHVSEFCDMCDLIRNQDKGMNKLSPVSVDQESSACRPNKSGGE